MFAKYVSYRIDRGSQRPNNAQVRNVDRWVDKNMKLYTLIIK